MKTLPRLPCISLLFAALAIVVAGATAHAVQSSAAENSQQFAEYRNDRWGFSLVVPTGMTVGEYDQSYGGQEFTFTDASGEKQFVISVTPYQELDLTLGREATPRGTSDQPDHLEIVDVVRDDTFKAWFTKNGVLYVVVTLADHEAWLTDLLSTWRFI